MYEHIRRNINNISNINNANNNGINVTSIANWIMGNYFRTNKQFYSYYVKYFFLRWTNDPDIG